MTTLLREDSKWNFVLGDKSGYEIDVHVFIADKDGGAVEGIMYPAGSFTGKGTINEIVMKCIAAEYVVKFHTGYELQDKDFRDVSAICEKFGIVLPNEYLKFI